jgi:hypothetical protein
MGMLRAIGASILTYFAVLLAVILSPLLFVLFLWTGLCMFAALFIFFFWLFVNHQTHTLYSALYMALWGCPPMVLAGLVGYYGAQIRARRTVPLLSLHGDVPFR